METSYNEILMNFKNKAKKQYKIYEDYLNKSEDLLNYSIDYSSKSIELISSLLENALLKNEYDIKEHFDSVKNIEETENVNTILDRFKKSEFLKKKFLFSDIKKNFKTKLHINIFELQSIYNKFLEEDRAKFSNSRIEHGGVNSSLASEILDGETKFQIYYKNLQDAVTQFTILLVKNFYESFNQDCLNDLSGALKTLLRTIKTYLYKLKDKIANKSIETDVSDLNLSLGNITNFNEEITELNKKLDLLEKLEYDKLLDLKEKNSKLRMIQNHVESLKIENEELSKTATESNYFFLEQKEIILSYERSIKDKKILINVKKLEINALKDDAEEKNNKLENLLIEIIDKENEINQVLLINGESNKQILELNKKIFKTSEHLVKVKKVQNEKNSNKEKKKNDLKKLNEIVKKMEDDILKIKKINNKSLEEEINRLENKFQDKIKEKIRMVN